MTISPLTDYHVHLSDDLTLEAIPTAPISPLQVSANGRRFVNRAGAPVGAFTTPAGWEDARLWIGVG